MYVKHFLQLPKIWNRFASTCKSRFFSVIFISFEIYGVYRETFLEKTSLFAIQRFEIAVNANWISKSDLKFWFVVFTAGSC